jgi:hypothetical protein
MYLWRIRPPRIREGLACLFCTVFLSCGFMDLRSIGIKVYPGEPGTVLPEPYTPVLLSFDTPMENFTTERVLQVDFSGGQVEGDLRWEGNDLSFVPAAPWSAGIGYTLTLSGTVYAQDGRELRLARHIPFFAYSRVSRPYLSSFIPSNGASVGVSPGEGGYLELYFSLPMDRKTTGDAFSLNGAGEPRFTWRDNDRGLRIDFEKPLSPWTVYHWTLGAGASSREGAPLVKSVSAWFSTDRDRLFPRVLRTYSMFQRDGKWVDTGGRLDGGLGSGLGIGVEFNKPMEEEGVLRALRFEPSLAGRTEQLSETTIVFIPDRDPEPEGVYTLFVSGDTRDKGGLKIGADYTEHFRTDIPYLRLLSVMAGSLEPWEGEELQNGAWHRVSLAEGGVLRLTLGFSLPLSDEAKTDAAPRISLDVFFPGGIAPAAPRSVRWPFDDQALMAWEGLEAGTADKAHYYRLTIPGGRNGIGNGLGSYLKEDHHIYLEIIK